MTADPSAGTPAPASGDRRLAILLAMAMFVLVVDTSLMNADARDHSLQVALLVPVLAGLIGLINGFRMRRLPDIEPTANLEGLDLS